MGQIETEFSSEASLAIIGTTYRIKVPVEVRGIDKDSQSQGRSLIDERLQPSKGKVEALSLVISNSH